MSSTPASYSQNGSTVSSNVNTITLPVLNKSLSGVNIATLNVNNGYLDVNINALTGPNSTISISKPGMSPLTLNGIIKQNIHIGSDNFNKLPFIGKQSVNVIFNAAPNETILVKEISYKSSAPLNYKKIAFIFLAVYFILNMFL